MSAILPLFVALAELHLSSKPLEQVAGAFQVSARDLYNAYAAAKLKLWQGRFAQALSDPHLDPDLLSQYSVLASFERLYGILMLQLQRAEENCAEAREQEPRDLKLIMKADAFALRTQQSAARMLRDLQKAEKALKKSLTPAADAPPSPPVDAPASTSQPDALARTSQPDALARTSQPDASARASQPEASARDEVQNNSANTPPLPTNHSPLPTSPAPTLITIPTPAGPLTYNPADHAAAAILRNIGVKDFQSLVIRHRDTLARAPNSHHPILLAHLFQRDQQKQAA